MIPRSIGCAIVVAASLGLSACEDGSFQSLSTKPAEFTRSATPEARIAALRSRLKQAPGSTSTLEALGREYEATGDWDAAAASYRELLILAPSNQSALVGYASAQVARGDYTDAYAHAAKAVKQRPNIDSLMVAGAALDGLGRQSEAQALYTQALAKSPRDLDIRNNLALSRALTGDPDAYAMMRAVAQAPDADIRHKSNLVLVAAILGRESDARKDGERLGVGKKDIETILKLGRRARTEGPDVFGIAGAF